MHIEMLLGRKREKMDIGGACSVTPGITALWCHLGLSSQPHLNICSARHLSTGNLNNWGVTELGQEKKVSQIME